MDTRIITADDWRQIAKRLPPPPPDAFKPGTRVEKVKTEVGDSQPIGARGMVILALPAVRNLGVGYVIEWDAMPGLPVVVIASKIHRIPTTVH